MDQQKQDGNKDVKPPTTRRLPSLRGPRDLTLGGVRKKTFAPTIPVRKERIKQEPKDGEPKSTPNKQSRSRRGSRGGRGRGRGRFKQEVIQSHSIFESGPSMEMIGKRPSSFSGGGGGGGAKDTIEKPTIKKEEFDAEYEKTKSEEALESLKGKQSFLSDLKSDDSVFPMSLPMSKASWPPGRPADKLNTDPGVVIKQEFASPKTMEPETVPSYCADIFMKNESGDAENSDMILLQLPDTLPALPPSADSEHEVKQNGAQESQKSSTLDTTDKGCTLDCLSEGYIGKLQVLKSGKCRLLLGKIVLDLDRGTPTSFHEEIVSIRLPPEEAGDSYQGHMTVVGDVYHKVVCMPDMESLILHEK